MQTVAVRSSRLKAFLVAIAGLAAAMGLAAPAGAEERIVFSVIRNQTFVIWSMRPDGTDLRAITPAGSSEDEPSLGADGALYYTHLTPGDYSVPGQVWRLRADGSREHLLDDAYLGRLSPDGKHLLFMRYDHTAFTGSVWTANPDGSDQHRLSGPADDADEATWSPDGTRIAFTLYGSGESTSAITLMAPDGTGAHPLTAPEPAYQYEPDWAPDGKTIAFADAPAVRAPVDPGLPAQSTITVTDTAGSNRRTLTPPASQSAELAPTWSPAGTRLAFTVAKQASEVPYELHLMQADGTGRMPAGIPGAWVTTLDWGDLPPGPSVAAPPVAPLPAAPAPSYIGPAQIRLGRRGTARLRVTCPAGRRRCQGTLKIDLLLHARGIRAGHARYSVPAGATGTVSIRLSRATRRLVARRGRISARVSGGPRRSSTQITLVGPRA